MTSARGLRRDLKIREITFRARPYPKGDVPFAFPVFQVVDQKDWLIGCPDIETSLIAGRLYPKAGLLAGNKVGIRFVQAGSFLPEPPPRMVREREVLRGVVSP